MELSNQRLAKILRNVAAAYTIKKIGNVFQIRAYENAADSIEQSTAEIQDLWQESKLDSIPTLGKAIQGYLVELFTKGRVSHFEEIKKGIPEVFFDVLDISGVGPKTAEKIADLGVKNLKDLEIKLKSGELVKKGFSAKLAQNILEGLQDFQKRIKSEEEFYKLLEDDASELGLEHKLPNRLKLEDIKGDLHLHSNFPIKSPSHGPGVDSIEEIVKKAEQMGYEYVGISDHPLGLSTTSTKEKINWVQKRTHFINQLQKSTKSIRVLNGLEIDILGDGSLSVPDEALQTLDYCIAGIHSGHRGSKDIITKRLISALNSPFVDIISHPTNRLLNKRGSSEADWPMIFSLTAKNHKLLEINASPNRLDLRDDLVKMALDYGVNFVINTDAHQLSQMDNMKFGVSVARRGWAQSKNIVNTWDWKDFAKWFKIDQ